LLQTKNHLTAGCSLRSNTAQPPVIQSTAYILFCRQAFPKIIYPIEGTVTRTDVAFYFMPGAEQWYEYQSCLLYLLLPTYLPARKIRSHRSDFRSYDFMGKSARCRRRVMTYILLNAALKQYIHEYNCVCCHAATF
jgi:hypothetical protein